ncbi:MAG TPA: hypothetical protein VFB42_04880 [Gaiellaceae bacterium]|nr:hypothetical protein [Gaiellaceae bacterium]
MRRLTWISATLLALVGAGIAVAHGGGSKAVAATSATFSATTPGTVRTSTCTAADGKVYATTHGRYTGAAASSDGALNGPATLDVVSLINQTDNVGTVEGLLRIDGSGGRTVAHVEAVYSGGHLAGVAEGHGSAPWNRLLANVSGDFSAAGGLANGKLGGGTAGGDAVVVTAGACRPAPSPKPETIQAHGNVTAVSGTSISVAGVTCNVPNASMVNGIQTGDRVEIKCTASGGANTLVRVERKHGDHH